MTRPRTVTIGIHGLELVFGCRSDASFFEKLLSVSEVKKLLFRDLENGHLKLDELCLTCNRITGKLALGNTQISHLHLSGNRKVEIVNLGSTSDLKSPDLDECSLSANQIRSILVSCTVPNLNLSSNDVDLRERERYKCHYGQYQTAISQCLSKQCYMQGRIATCETRTQFDLLESRKQSTGRSRNSRVDTTETASRT